MEKERKEIVIARGKREGSIGGGAYTVVAGGRAVVMPWSGGRRNRELREKERK